MAQEVQTVYETVYILKSGIAESDAATIHQKVDNVISKFGGKLVHRDDWGIKDLAFMIDKERSGRYVVTGYTGRGGVVEEIERHFRILEDVIRFITVKVEPGYDYGKFRKQVHDQEEEHKKAREFREPKKRFRDRADFSGGGREGRGDDFGG